jgi:hypothetical protein
MERKSGNNSSKIRRSTNNTSRNTKKIIERDMKNEIIVIDNCRRKKYRSCLAVDEKLRKVDGKKTAKKMILHREKNKRHKMIK